MSARVRAMEIIHHRGSGRRLRLTSERDDEVFLIRSIRERSHRVDDQEFYQLLDQDGISDDIYLFNEKLREWEDYYNYHRPHGALEGQTPYERLLGKTRAVPSPKA
jgi:transposase InsO family protein